MIPQVFGWGEKHAHEVVGLAKQMGGVEVRLHDGGVASVTLTPEGVRYLTRLNEGRAIREPPGRPAKGTGTTTVFFSWQSDIRAAACRSLIQDALEAAARNIAQDKQLGVEPVIDRDTQSVPGAPDIGATILAKIEAAAAFVADVTIVGRTVGGKPTPNPNVLIELGYALKAVGWSRILLVQNTAMGPPESLPFDLRQKRAIVYSSAEDAEERAPERRALQGKLEVALRGIVRVGSSAPQVEVELTLTRKDKRITSKHHDYELIASVKNTGNRRLDDWEIEVEFPTPLLDGTIHAIKVDERSDAESTLFRLDGRRIGKELRPGDEQFVKIGFFVNNDIFWKRQELFERVAKARALVDGEIVAEVERQVRELQNF